MAACPQGPTIVKLGGSYALSPRLPAILAAIRASHAPVVVVPGGGPFADAVREAQPRMGYGDKPAHRMALLAMAQYAEALAGLGDGLRVAPDLAAIQAVLGARDVAVWSPWPMADGLEALPQSWDLTSDSLAAWLAGKLGASRLLLLKHRDPPDGGGMSFTEAAEAGLVDPLFPEYAGHGQPPLPRGESGGEGVRAIDRARPLTQSRWERAPEALPKKSWDGEERRRGAGDSGMRDFCIVRWLGPRHLDMLTAILDGRAEAGAALRPALPA